MGVETISGSLTTVTTTSTTKLAPKGPNRVIVSPLQRTLWICNTFYYQILGTVTVILFWLFFAKAEQYGSHFTTHLVLSTAAYIPLMAVSIILFSDDNVTTLYIPRTNRNWIHGVLLILSTVFLTVGIGIESYDKSKAERPHFKSDHAKYGLASWILVFVSLVLGVVAANTRTFSSYVRPVVSKLFHNVLGLLTFALGIASIWEERKALTRYYGLSDDALTGVEVGIIFVTIWSGLAALKSLWNQIIGVFT